MKKFKFTKFKKISGILIPFSIKKSFPFIVKRIFFIKGKKKFIRGEHAHKKCSQFLFPVSGKMQVFYESKYKRSQQIMDSTKNKGYLVEPYTWLKIRFLTKNDILMVACDREYEYKDYIKNYSLFKKFIKKI